jgi:uncharacterized membrane protein required for colicin V production
VLLDLLALALLVAPAVHGAKRGVLGAAPFALGAALAAAVVLLFGRVLAAGFRVAFELPSDAAGITSALAAFLAVYAAAGAGLLALGERLLPGERATSGAARRAAGAAVGALHGVLLAWWLLSCVALLDRPVPGYGAVWMRSESSSAVRVARKVNLVALGGDAPSRARLGTPGL